jgi:hypothetical protein
MKRVLFGLLWAAIFYYGTCFVAGAVHGLQWSARHPGPVNQAALRREAEEVAPPLLPYFLGGAITLAVVGAGTGILPGTRRAH